MHNKNKTHIKKKIYMASSLSDLTNNKKGITKRKNRNRKQIQNQTQSGGQDEPRQQKAMNNQSFQEAEQEDLPEDFNLTNEQKGEQQMGMDVNNMEERQPQEHALVGTYNNPNKGKHDLQLNEAIEKSRGGLYLSYPPPMNTNKETALALKKRDKREEGFTDYKGQITDELEPKFLAEGFYPKFSLFYEVSKSINTSQKQNQNLNKNLNQEQNQDQFITNEEMEQMEEQQMK